MSLYTAEVEAAFKSTPRPYPGFIVDVVEYPGYLALRTYSDNVEDFSDPQKAILAQYMVDLEKAIRSCGVNVIFDRVHKSPPNWGRR